MSWGQSFTFVCACYAASFLRLRGKEPGDPLFGILLVNAVKEEHQRLFMGVKTLYHLVVVFHVHSGCFIFNEYITITGVSSGNEYAQWNGMAPFANIHRFT